MAKLIDQLKEFVKEAQNDELEVYGTGVQVIKTLSLGSNYVVELTFESPEDSEPVSGVIRELGFESHSLPLEEDELEAFSKYA